MATGVVPAMKVLVLPSMLSTAAAEPMMHVTQVNLGVTASVTCLLTGVPKVSGGIR
jgi:hypothetical protein